MLLRSFLFQSHLSSFACDKNKQILFYFAIILSLWLRCLTSRVKCGIDLSCERSNRISVVKIFFTNLPVNRYNTIT